MGTDLDALSQIMPLVQGGFFVALLLLASIFDIRDRIIPDSICIAIAITSLFAFEPMKLLGIITAVILYGIAYMLGGIYGGDIKLMAAAGLVLGFAKSMTAVIIGLTAMVVFHVCRVIIQKSRGRTVQSGYPLAPFLSLGCLAAYFIL